MLLARDYERMLGLAVAILESRQPDPPWPMMVQEVTHALHGSTAFFVEVQWASQIGHVQAWTPKRLGDLPLNTLLHRNIQAQHPMARHYATTGDQTPLTISDIVGTRTWRSTESYALTRQAFGTTRVMGLPLRAPAGIVRIVVIHRSGKDFTDHERTFARRLQPLLASADSHLRHIRRWRDTVTDERGVIDYKLTPREITVLTLLAESLTTDAIGRRLGITTRTVQKHTEHLYRKLGTSDRLSTVLRAQTLGLINHPISGQYCGDLRGRL